MAQQRNFRSAFNGFNREDVVQYIDYLNSTHNAEISKLTSELEFLRGKLAQQPPIWEMPVPQVAPPAQEEEVDPVLEQQAARTRELFDQCRDLEQALADANAENEALRAQLEAAQQQQTSFQSRMEEELEAYRRAERTERLARERAEQMYRQANGALSDATIKVDDAASQIGQLSDRVVQQLTELQTAVSGSKQALRDAAATMYTIRPTSDPN